MILTDKFSRMPAHSSSLREAPVLFPLILIACVVLTVLTALGPLAGLFAHVSIDYGEGWNAYWSATAMKGAPLYTTTHDLVANNYPPLSFYVNGLLGAAIGDHILAGRLVALASVLAVATLIGRIVAILGGARRWAFVSALVFLLYNLVYFRQFVAVDNPQWLGQAVMLAGVLPLLGAGRLRARSIMTAAALMVAGGLVKHNQFALPMAATLWLLVRDRRAFVIWCLSGIALVAAVCLVFQLLYGPAVFAELIGFKRTTDMANFRAGLSKTASLIPLAIVGVLSIGQWRTDPRWALLGLYALLGIAFGILQRLGSGVYVNAHFDALIGVTILSGAFLGTAATGQFRDQRRGRALLLLLALLPVLVVGPQHALRSIREARDMPRREAAWSAIIADARRAPNPVLCEILAVCYWAGKPLELDFFAYGQKLRTGTDPAPLERIIATRSASLLILDPAYDRQAGESRLPAPIPAMMAAHYRVVREWPLQIQELAPRER